MLTVELKRCPFCNGDADIARDEDLDWYVECSQCECGTAIFPHPEPARDAWNARYKEQPND